MRSSDDSLRATPIKVTVPVSPTTSPEQALNKAINLLSKGGWAVVTEVTVNALQLPEAPPPRGS